MEQLSHKATLPSSVVRNMDILHTHYLKKSLYDTDRRCKNEIQMFVMFMLICLFVDQKIISSMLP